MSFINISKSAFFHNLDVIKDKVGSIDKIAIVIKDNAYGHDIKLISSLCKQYGITKAVVRNIKEANEIYEYFENIIVLNKTTDKVDNKISQVINCVDELRDICPNSKIELKVDTLMSRNGILMDEIDDALKSIQEKNLILNGVMTHFASADMLDCSYFIQKQNFLKIQNIVISFCQKNNIKKPLFHSYNSSATFRNNSQFDDFVRVGISAYGYLYLDEVFDSVNLKPVMSLWANRISKRKVGKNSFVGYGLARKIDENCEIGNYDIGYSDGFFRLNENQKYTLPNKSEILGRVSMDNFSANCTDDIICVFEDANKLAKINNTITYDVLVKLNKDIKKKIV